MSNDPSAPPSRPVTRRAALSAALAAGPPGVLRTVHSAAGESDEGLDIAASIVVEGELVVIR